MKNKINTAFSLVEISVVILVIGILISGISTGVDLYRDYKISSARNYTINSKVSRIRDIGFWLDTTRLKSLETASGSFDPINGDKIKNWNVLYGKNGFIQYQFFIPVINSYKAIRKIMKLIQSKSSVSFLTTLKYMGKDNATLAFASKGFAVAFDFKNTDFNLKLLNNRSLHLLKKYIHFVLEVLNSFHIYLQYMMCN
jgi:prepilin-type N-terminal cleavage/methylation domain-containing protein